MFEKIFKKTNKNDKDRIYKFVYRTRNFSDRKTLLVVSKNTTSAIKKFYRIAGAGNVSDILEFTEIKYGNGETEDV